MIFPMYIHCSITDQAIAGAVSSLVKSMTNEVTTTTVQNYKDNKDKRLALSIIQKETDVFLRSSFSNYLQIDKKKIVFTRDKRVCINDMIRFMTSFLNDTEKKKIGYLLKKNKSQFANSIASVLQNKVSISNNYSSTMLIGKPGTGKTTILEIIAIFYKTIRNYTTKQIDFYKFSGAALNGCNKPQSALRGFMDKVEQQIKDGHMVIMLIDEGEQLFKKRDKNSMSTVFLEFMSLMNSSNYKGKLLIVSATNISGIFDQSSIRRFNDVIEFDVNSRSNCIMHFYNKIPLLLPKKIGKNLLNHELLNDIIEVFLDNLIGNDSISPAEIENILNATALRSRDMHYLLAFILAFLQYIRKEITVVIGDTETSVQNKFMDIADELDKIFHESDSIGFPVTMKIFLQKYFFNTSTSDKEILELLQQFKEKITQN